MTTLQIAVPSGVQQPRVSSLPDFPTSAGVECVELAASTGLFMDPWQEFVLHHSLGERLDGLWQAGDVGLVVSRQNGKNAILEARYLGGLFLFDERLLIHTAHEMKAAAETFKRIVELITGTADLSRHVKNVAYSKGEEGIELHSRASCPTQRCNGNRLRFMARTSGSGRSFSADVLGLDEAYNLPQHVMSALTPTLATRRNAQVWYTSSAVNQLEHPHGLTLARVRRRGLRGWRSHEDRDQRLAYFEWSGDEDEYQRQVTAGTARTWVADREVIAIANPNVNMPNDHSISFEYMQDELERLGVHGFAVEHLSIGDWPVEPTAEADKVLDPALWAQLVDRTSVPQPPFALAVTVSKDADAACVTAAGWNEAGLVHLEVLAHAKNTSWVVDYMLERQRKNEGDICAVMIDPSGPAGPLITPLQNAGIENLVEVNFREYAQACGNFLIGASERALDELPPDARQETLDEVAALFGIEYDPSVILWPKGKFRHQNDVRLNTALENVKTRPLMRAWVWDQVKSPVDISPLIGVTLAAAGLEKYSNEGTVNLW